MERKDQSSPAAQLLQLLRFALAGGLQLHVDQLASRSCRFVQKIELGRNRTPELASAGRAAAGSNHDRSRMVFDKTLDPRKHRARLREIVQPELQKGVIS